MSKKRQPALSPESVSAAPADARHFVYLLACADGTLYTGYTTDVARRLAAHNAGKGARYTRGRRPLILLAQWSFPTKGDALRAELALKQQPRTEKLRLAQAAQANEETDQSTALGHDLRGTNTDA